MALYVQQAIVDPVPAREAIEAVDTCEHTVAIHAQIVFEADFRSYTECIRGQAQVGLKVGREAADIHTGAIRIHPETPVLLREDRKRDNGDDEARANARKSASHTHSLTIIFLLAVRVKYTVDR